MTRSACDVSVFLAACDVIDWRCDAVRGLAAQFATRAHGLALVSQLFAWVRDEVAHTGDAGQGAITLRASDVLRERTGLCYAKSHLLAALLRASGIPAGLCYQRLRSDDAGSAFVLHGLVAVWMPEAQRFVRIDPRGNKPGIDAQFIPGREALAFRVEHSGEADLPGVFARPLPAVVAALCAASDWRQLDGGFPDLAPEHWPAADAAWERAAD
jgi:transglutaminase-like putative cysteine protease